LAHISRAGDRLFSRALTDPSDDDEDLAARHAGAARGLADDLRGQQHPRCRAPTSCGPWWTRLTASGLWAPPDAAAEATAKARDQKIERLTGLLIAGLLGRVREVWRVLKGAALILRQRLREEGVLPANEREARGSRPKLQLAVRHGWSPELMPNPDHLRRLRQG
jgi:hypothetical protein